MPVEVPGFDVEPSASTARVFVATCRSQLREAEAKIRHCVGQLTAEELCRAPGPGMNSIQTLCVHLAGNLTQWVTCPLTGKPDTRNRASEFIPQAEAGCERVLEELTAAVDAACAALEGLLAAQGPVSVSVSGPGPGQTAERDPLDERLTAVTRVQGFEAPLLTELFDTVAHFVGHTHQVVMLTRWIRGPEYRFQWAPATSEHGA